MVNKAITVRLGKCTTLLVPKSWPMKAWLWDVDQWNAENLSGLCNWPITRCFIQNDRASLRLIIEQTTNFALSGNFDGLCNTCTSREDSWFIWKNICFSNILAVVKNIHANVCIYFKNTMSLHFMAFFRIYLYIINHFNMLNFALFHVLLQDFKCKKCLLHKWID